MELAAVSQNPAQNSVKIAAVSIMAVEKRSTVEHVSRDSRAQRMFVTAIKQLVRLPVRTVVKSPMAAAAN